MSTTYMLIMSLSLPLNDLFFQGPACLKLVGKSRTSSRTRVGLLLTDISPQTRAAKVTWQMFAMGYAPRCLLTATFLCRLHSFNTIIAQDTSALPCGVPQRAFSPGRWEMCMGPEGAWTSWSFSRKIHLLHFQNRPECFDALLALPLCTHWGNFSWWSQPLGYWSPDFID